MLSSWKSLGFVFLAVSQVVTIYLLVNVAQRQEAKKASDHGRTGWQVPRNIYHGSKTAQEKIAVEAGPPPKYHGSALYVEPKSSSSTSSCVKRTITAGRCSNEARGVQRPQGSARDTCAFDLDESDIVFGVWHSLATEGRLQPLLDTWGKRVQVVLLASTVGVEQSKLFHERAPGSRPHLLGGY